MTKMIFNNTIDFINHIENSKPILAIDYGEKNIGVAISDKTQTIAFALGRVHNQTDIFKILQEKKPIGVVMGLPIDLQGNQTPLCAKILKFAEKIDIAVLLKDERYTSRLADMMLKMSGNNLEQRRKLDDEMSACILLQEVLDKIQR